MQKYIHSICLILFCSLLSIPAQPNQQSIIIEGYADPSKVIPVSLSGFSGEVDAVLRYDLWIAGFEFVTEKPQYLISGRNNGNVEGRVVDALNPARSLLARAYNGGTQRSQAHALANDIILAITGKKGVAGTKIAFRVDQGNTSEIFVADYDGFGAKAITSDSSEVMHPAWVPGRFHLFYATRRSGPIQIMSHNLQTGSRQVFARYPNSNYSPAISPDGRKVAMILTQSGSPDLYVADIDGSNLKQLTKTREDESSPCWSPDGSTICYVGRGAGGRSALFTIPAEGGTRKQLNVGVFNPTEPDWSPDGKHIAFTRMAGAFEVCVIPAGGGNATVLTQGEDPSWAPNSRTIIFTRRKTNNTRVLSLLDVPTKRVKDVAQISGSSSQPSWSR